MKAAHRYPITNFKTVKVDFGMNKRIKELYREAIIYTMDNAGNKGQSSSDAMCADKFAELIILECAGHAVDFNNNIQSLNAKEIRSHANRINDYIKDRMGVEQ